MESKSDGQKELIAQNVELEKALLGGLLLDPDELPNALLLDPDDFYMPMHQQIYRAIIAQRNDGLPVDYVCVFDRLHGQISFDYFCLLNAAALPGHTGYIARKLKDSARRRKAQEKLRESIETLGLPTADLEVQFEALSGDFVKLLADKGSSTIQDGMVKTLRAIDAASTREIIKTGLAGLDRLVTGMFPGKTWIIAGRTSMGKTALGKTLCLNIARAGHVVGWVSVEGDTDEFHASLLSMQSKIPVRRIIGGELSDAEGTKVLEASRVLAKLKIHTVENEWRWEKLRAAIQLMKFKDPRLQVVFVDYLGLIKSQQEYEDRTAVVTEISADFHRLMQSLELTGVMVCQINRQTENRKDHRPTLADLRESGAVEQDADVVLLLYRPVYYSPKEDPRLAEISVAKHRLGPTGIVMADFDAPTLRWGSRIDRPEPPEPDKKLEKKP